MGAGWWASGLYPNQAVETFSRVRCLPFQSSVKIVSALSSKAQAFPVPDTHRLPSNVSIKVPEAGTCDPISTVWSKLIQA